MLFLDGNLTISFDAGACGRILGLVTYGTAVDKILEPWPETGCWALASEVELVLEL